MPLRWRENDSGDYVYCNPSRSRKKIYVDEYMLGFIADVCDQYDVGDSLLAGNLSLSSLEGALTDLRTLENALKSDDSVNEDDYMDVAEAADDLAGIIRRVETIA